MNLQNLSFEELNDLSKQIVAEIQTRRVDEEKKLIQDIRQKAGALGISSEQLAKLLAVKGSGANKSGNKVAPIFRHPESGSEWSGRGRAPNWYKEWVEGGKSVDELRI